MKIYETAPAPNPRRVRIFLAEKGVDMEYVQIDIQSGENLSEEYRRKNPTTRVPVLELDDGTYIGETVAICRYFEELHPEPSLMGTTPLEKATIEMWQRRAELHLWMPVAMCFRHTTGYFKDRMTVVPDWGDVSREEALEFMPVLDDHLADSEYLAGDSFSIADITAMCALDFARVIKLTPGEDLVNLKRWHDAVSARPSAGA